MVPSVRFESLSVSLEPTITQSTALGSELKIIQECFSLLCTLQVKKLLGTTVEPNRTSQMATSGTSTTAVDTGASPKAGKSLRGSWIGKILLKKKRKDLASLTA